MPTRSLFATRFYEAALDDAMLLAELEEACLDLAEQDVAGQNWSETHLYHGYTSYASLNDLPQRDPRIGDLVRHLNRHVAAFAKDCAFDLGGKRLKLDRSEEHTSELQSLMRISYAVFCLKNKTQLTIVHDHSQYQASEMHDRPGD